MKPPAFHHAASALLLAGLAAGDAGYMGSLLPGPSPALPGAPSTDIGMVAEDVFLELLPDGRAALTGSFLFAGEGSGSPVLMAFPFEISTVFSPPGYAVSDGETDQPRGFDLVVEVNGERVEPFVLVQVTMDKGDLGSGFSAFLDRYDYFTDDRARGMTRLVIPPDSGDSLVYDFDFANRADAVLACWPVSVPSGDTVLVEIRTTGRLTSDYSENLFRLSYPLVTGASWAGTIGRGRICLVPGEGFDWNTLQWYTGVCMPTSATYEDWLPGLLPEFVGFAPELIREVTGREYTDAVVWEFSDFEPVAGRRDTYTFFPDFGDIYALVQTAWEDGDPIQPWRSSFVYAFVGPQAPTDFTVVSGTGLDLFDGCFRGAGTVGTVSPGSVLGVLETCGGWMRLSCEGYLDRPSLEGWFLPGLPGSDGIVEPELMPSPEGYWEP